MLKSQVIELEQASLVIEHHLSAGRGIVQSMLSVAGGLKFSTRRLQLFILQIQFDLVHLKLVQQSQGIVCRGGRCGQVKQNTQSHTRILGLTQARAIGLQQRFSALAQARLRRCERRIFNGHGQSLQGVLWGKCAGGVQR